MKKIHLFAAVAALLLSGGVFMEAYNAQRIGLPTNDLLLENLTAITDPAMPTGFAVSGRRAVEQDEGTCGLVAFKEETYPNYGYRYKAPECGHSLDYINKRADYWRRNNYSINYCCDSCKDTWYCGN